MNPPGRPRSTGIAIYSRCLICRKEFCCTAYLKSIDEWEKREHERKFKRPIPKFCSWECRGKSLTLRQTKLRADQQDQMLAMYNNGSNLDAIAESLNISRAHVWRCLRKHHASFRKPWSSKRRIAWMYNQAKQHANQGG